MRLFAKELWNNYLNPQKLLSAGKKINIILKMKLKILIVTKGNAEKLLTNKVKRLFQALTNQEECFYKLIMVG